MKKTLIECICTVPKIAVCAEWCCGCLHQGSPQALLKTRGLYDLPHSVAQHLYYAYKIRWCCISRGNIVSIVPGKDKIAEVLDYFARIFCSRSV